MSKNPIKIAVIGATGKSGQLIVKEALQRKLEVTAIIRNSKLLKHDISFIEKDIQALNQEDILQFDVVVSAYGVALGREIEHESILNHYISIFSGTKVRLIIVGSAGHLYTDASKRQKVYEIVDIIWKQSSLELERIYCKIYQIDDILWTYMAPSKDFIPKGKRTGFYQSGTDTILYDKNGESQISYADFAIALLDEIENPQYIQQTFTIAAL